MPEILDTNQMDGTFEMFLPMTFQKPNYSLEDFLAPLFQLRENERDSLWTTPEGLSLLRCFASLGISEYHIYSLKMLKDYSTTMEGEPFKSSSKSWMAWGMTLNGNCWTAKISESRNTENAFSLSEILEENPDPKYFLSEEQTRRMMTKTENRQLKSPNGDEDISDPINLTEFLL